LLCDVSVVQKPYFSSLLQATPRTGIHSVIHGVTLRETSTERSATVRSTLPPHVRERIKTQFLLSTSEEPHYHSAYGISTAQMHVSGVFRHDPEWVARLRSHGDTRGLEAGSYMFLVSRPVNPRYLQHAEKKRIIVMAHEQARKRGLTLVIRRHPFESNQREFERLLGKPGKRNRWLETVRHSMDIGLDCAVAVTLNSSVAVDLAAIGVPVIDPVDYSKLQEGSPTTRFDDDGRPVSIHCKAGIAVGAPDETSFSVAVDQLARRGRASKVQPSTAYRALYADPNGAIRNATRRILESARS